MIWVAAPSGSVQVVVELLRTNTGFIQTIKLHDEPQSQLLHSHRLSDEVLLQLVSHHRRGALCQSLQTEQSQLLL